MTVQEKLEICSLNNSFYLVLIFISLKNTTLAKYFSPLLLTHTHSALGYLARFKEYSYPISITDELHASFS